MFAHNSLKSTHKLFIACEKKEWLETTSENNRRPKYMEQKKIVLRNSAKFAGIVLTTSIYVASNSDKNPKKKRFLLQCYLIMK